MTFDLQFSDTTTRMTEGLPSLLFRALEASAKALDPALLNNLERKLGNGQLIYKILNKSYHVTAIISSDEKERIWAKIKDRIEEIFAPGLINWEHAKEQATPSNSGSSEKRITLGGTLSKSGTLTAKPTALHKNEGITSNADELEVQSLNETYCISNRQEEKNSLTDTCNTDQYGVALLALFVCCVFDQNQDLYNALYSLDEKTQSRVTSAFKYLIGMC